MTPDRASTSSGQNIASTSSGHNMASTFIGLQGRNVNMSSFCDACADRRHNHMPPNARKALEGANFIAKHLGGEDESKRVSRREYLRPQKLGLEVQLKTGNHHAIINACFD